MLLICQREVVAAMHDKLLEYLASMKWWPYGTKLMNLNNVHFFAKETYMKAYEFLLEPLNVPQSDSLVLPPKVKKCTIDKKQKGDFKLEK